jgi:hypothetical protein
VVSGFVWASTEWRDQGLLGLIAAFRHCGAGARPPGPLSFRLQNFDLMRPVLRGWWSPCWCSW